MRMRAYDLPRLVSPGVVDDPPAETPLQTEVDARHEVSGVPKTYGVRALAKPTPLQRCVVKGGKRRWRNREGEVRPAYAHLTAATYPRAEGAEPRRTRGVDPQVASRQEVLAKADRHVQQDIVGDLVGPPLRGLVVDDAVDVALLLLALALRPDDADEPLVKPGGRREERKFWRKPPPYPDVKRPGVGAVSPANVGIADAGRRVALLADEETAFGSSRSSRRCPA